MGEQLITTMATKIRILIVLFFILCAAPLLAEEPAKETAKEPKREYSEMGADMCLMCHGEGYSYPVVDIFKSPHGVIEDKNSPMGQMQCETCHGPKGNHPMMNASGTDMTHMVNFGKKSRHTVEQQNQVCLRCHRDQSRYLWTGSEHAANQLSCAHCHVLHRRSDPMKDSKQQIKVCVTCHKKQKAQFQMSSSHPLRQGIMMCSQCHNPHGSTGDHLVKTSSTNQLCYTCHAEKRGPFLWSHAPVNEECTLCHQPHGSIHRFLLNKRPPFLCQQCHTGITHANLVLTPGDRTGPRDYLLMQRACMNCHSMVHGSNHPSGVKLMR